jgi:two-component system, NtrC family, response regulator AlgB
MATAGTSENINYIRTPSPVGVLSRFVARSEASEEDHPMREKLRPLLNSRNPRMIAILESAKRAASAPATILLMGESGVGKRLLARQIHDWSPCRERRFASVDCARISESLVEAETPEQVAKILNGTGTGDHDESDGDRPGTIFLDNIAELVFDAQTKLLHFVAAMRLNSVTFDPCSDWTRIIAASDIDLASEVQAKKFRSDLFYRINVVSLRLPSLRERPQDLLPFAEAILREEAIRYRRPSLQFSAEARFAIQHRGWLGNSLELCSVIESAAILCSNDLIKVEDLPKLNTTYANVAVPGAATPPAPRKLRDVERNHIADILASGVTAEEAANILGISSSTLCRKRKRYNLW